MAQLSNDPVNCPVCKCAAVDIGRKDFDGKVIRCANCKDYEISGQRMLVFLAADAEHRADALAKAKRFARPGQRPLIDSRCI